MNAKHLFWIIPLTLLIGMYVGAWVLGHFQQDFFKLGVDAGSHCSHLYNTEYAEFPITLRQQLFFKCVDDYPDVKDTTVYMIEIAKEV